MNIDAYMGYICLTAFFLTLVLIYLLVSRGKALKAARASLAEKDEKIQWLRQVQGENERKLNTRIQELEKELTHTEHTIDTLEQKIQEGTKNQVVAKLESLQHKRKQALNETGLES